MVNILLKRSTDETPWEEGSDLDCYIWNYERYAQTLGTPEFFSGMYIVDVNDVNGTVVCQISFDGERWATMDEYVKERLSVSHGPTKYIACDCSDPENFDFEDNGRFFHRIS